MTQQNEAPQPLQIKTPAPAAMPTPGDLGISPLMQSSLPPVASGADVYVRQFYGGANLPRRRFLPLGIA